MDDLWSKVLWGILIFDGAILFITLLNLREIPRLGMVSGGQDLPLASILIPARNEADKIVACLESLLSQNYPDYEILVLDDQSTDRTAELVSKLAHSNPRLTLLSGQPIPEGWLGKNWACHQLSEAARGEIFLFSDADTIHHPDSLGDGVRLSINSSVEMLSAIPLERLASWSERLTIPMIVWILVSLIPYRLAGSIRLPHFGGVIGQYILIRRESYLAIGGHQAIRDQIVDDLALGQRARSRGLPTLLADGTSRVECRMYTGWREVFDGLGKNLFAVFDRHILTYSFAWSWLLFSAWLPLAILTKAGLRASFISGHALQFLLVLTIPVLTWWLVLNRFHLPRGLAMIYPLILLCSAGLAFISFLLFISGRATWKGRRLPARGVL